MALAAESLAAEPTSLPYGKLMKVAYQTGKEIGYPETIQGLLLRETNGGRYRGAAQAAQNDPCYGVMQIKLETAKFVLAKNASEKDVIHAASNIAAEIVKYMKTRGLMP